jgi:hypothetical protein
MAELSVPESKRDFYKNFEQIKPLMNKTEAYYKSSRCLFCFDAPCTEACPTKIDIPLFIRQINTGNTMGVTETIYNSNYLGAICSKALPNITAWENLNLKYKATADDIPSSFNDPRSGGLEHTVPDPKDALKGRR